MYRWKYYNQVGTLRRGECGTEEELHDVLNRDPHRPYPGDSEKNFRQYSTDQGRTWSDY